MKPTNHMRPLALAKLQSVLFGLIGLVLGILYSFGGLLVDTLVTIGWVTPAMVGTPGLSMGTALAFGALLGIPLIGIVCGYVTGLIEAVLYNLFARFFGGVSLKIM